MDSTTPLNLRAENIGIAYLPTRGFTAIWVRNFVYFKRYWLSALGWSVVEPILYLFAVGFGLGEMVEKIGDRRYVEFFFPALLIFSSVWIATLECTFPCLSKLKYQGTYSAISLTPLSPTDIVFGEVLWAASKSMLGAVCVLLVGTVAGVVTTAWILPSLFIVFLTAMIFAGAGLAITTRVSNYDSFTYLISGVVLPLTLFSGTYFPLDRLPPLLMNLSYVSPITHAVIVSRSLSYQEWDHSLWVHVLVLLGFLMLSTVWAIRSFHRRLIP
ncbi:MAG: ABC transporter permease [Bdellovibrionales bacterium CG10_big_fil_rev_8_21_14_0_10_45_34]|nr:MAG: ABC transporter permease [Bdellovibrionales bacterium CG10_big_fil_rev_8_21_14_0_10_45_34]